MANLEEMITDAKTALFAPDPEKLYAIGTLFGVPRIIREGQDEETLRAGVEEYCKYIMSDPTWQGFVVLPASKVSRELINNWRGVCAVNEGDM